MSWAATATPWRLKAALFSNPLVYCVTLVNYGGKLFIRLGRSGEYQAPEAECEEEVKKA